MTLRPSPLPHRFPGATRLDIAEHRADEADRLLRELATAVARIAPLDFAFEQLDEKGKIGETAQIFASLADQYGS
ncbi:MAG TPA: hypothetical protein VLM11_03840 [Streptosporangiaceae bacterium]|nr:hypothetical protein [Streptosporangiaceae bacterium]